MDLEPDDDIESGNVIPIGTPAATNPDVPVAQRRKINEISGGAKVYRMKRKPFITVPRVPKTAEEKKAKKDENRKKFVAHLEIWKGIAPALKTSRDARAVYRADSMNNTGAYKSANDAGQTATKDYIKELVNQKLITAQQKDVLSKMWGLRRDAAADVVYRAANLSNKLAIRKIIPFNSFLGTATGGPSFNVPSNDQFAKVPIIAPGEEKYGDKNQHKLRSMQAMYENSSLYPRRRIVKFVSGSYRKPIERTATDNPKKTFMEMIF